MFMKPGRKDIFLIRLLFAARSACTKFRL